MKREDDTLQHKAVREALTNSIIHSDVFLSGGILRIEKHNDRLCFRNPGTLKLPLEEIYEGGNSKARNPKMQDMLRMIGFGENLGSGFPKILDAWKDAKWKAPLLEDRQTTEEVRLTLPIPFLDASEDKEIVIEDGIDNVLEKLTERQRVIYDTLKADVRDNVRDNVRDDVNETTETLARKLSVSSRTIRRDLDKMKSLGIVKREGGDYGGKWVVIPSK